MCVKIDFKIELSRHKPRQLTDLCNVTNRPLLNNSFEVGKQKKEKSIKFLGEITKKKAKIGPA